MALCCTCVSTGEVGIFERFGKFVGLAPPGVSFFCWPLTDVASKVSLRVQQLMVDCDTKTKDNVFVVCRVSVQYQVLRDKCYEATYSLSNPTDQIRAYVFDVVRSTVPRMDLDDAFESKDEISNQVKEQLSKAMGEYGFFILKALVTDVDPDQRVKRAMNEINANYRLKEAALEKAEADKILVVKAAEAHCESQHLSGKGVANQRKAIVDGLKDSISDFTGDIQGTSPQEVINLLMVTQYFDMLENVGSKCKNSTVFLKHSPAAVTQLQSELAMGLSGKK